VGRGVRVCDGKDALAYKVAEHCLGPIKCDSEGGVKREGASVGRR